MKDDVETLVVERSRREPARFKIDWSAVRDVAYCTASVFYQVAHGAFWIAVGVLAYRVAEFVHGITTGKLMIVA
jgi:hypothetical protein